MTAITLNFWRKTYNDGAMIARVYINAGDDGRHSLGYFEKRTSVAGRGASGYYDRHRIAKGDRVSASEEFGFSGPDALRDRVIVALGIAERPTDPWHLFEEVAKRARNGRPCWYQSTPKAEAKRLEKARDSAVYEIDVPE